MENLKFRAFHKEKKIMCDVLLICFVNRYVDVLPEYALEGGDQEVWGFDEIILMQSSGVVDKRNNLIFEGDIWEKQTYPRNRILVKYQHGLYNVSEFITQRGLVLGNIHENSELL